MSFLRNHRQLTEFRFEELAEFVRETRKGVVHAWPQFSKQFEKLTAGWTAERVDAYADDRYDDIALYRDSLPQLLRQSQCLMIFGTFEHSAASLCRSAHLDGIVADKPPKKLYMQHVQPYLQQHLRRQPVAFGREWRWMEDFRVLRNAITHAGGIVKKSDDLQSNWVQLRSFHQRNRRLFKLEEYRAVVIEDGLIDQALVKAKRAIVTLAAAIRR